MRNMLTARAGHDHDQIAIRFIPFIRQPLKSQPPAFNLCPDVWSKHLDIHDPSQVPATEAVYELGPFRLRNLSRLHGVPFRHAGRSRLCHFVRLIRFWKNQ